jgi:hemerythrin superfamily protein
MANAMDAISLLTSDHTEVRKMFQEFERGGSQNDRFFMQLQEALKMHTTIEEEIFYPAVQPHLPDLVREARQEHQKVDRLLADLVNIQPQDIRTEEMMRELMKDVEHHASEEESEMFPKAREILGMEENRRLGEQMKQRKIALMGQRGRTAA